MLVDPEPLQEPVEASRHESVTDSPAGKSIDEKFIYHNQLPENEIDTNGDEASSVPDSPPFPGSGETRRHEPVNELPADEPVESEFTYCNASLECMIGTGGDEASSVPDSPLVMEPLPLSFATDAAIGGSDQSPRHLEDEEFGDAHRSHARPDSALDIATPEFEQVPEPDRPETDSGPPGIDSPLSGSEPFNIPEIIQDQDSFYTYEVDDPADMVTSMGPDAVDVDTSAENEVSEPESEAELEPALVGVGVGVGEGDHQSETFPVCRRFLAASARLNTIPRRARVRWDRSRGRSKRESRSRGRAPQRLRRRSRVAMPRAPPLG